MPPWTSSNWLVIGGIMDYIIDHGEWKLVTEDNGYGEMEAIDIGIGWKGDGVILYRATEQELDYFKKNSIAVCLMSSEGPDGGFPRVIPDNYEVGVKAAQHLLETGAQHFGFLARGETSYQEEELAPGKRVYSRTRLKGYKEELKSRGFEPNVFYLKGYPLWKSDSWKKVEKDILDYLVTLPKHTAIFAADDPLAAVVLRVAEKSGIKVPEDLMVLGFGNTLNYCHASFPSMSSIVYPAREIGYRIAESISSQLTAKKKIPSTLEVSINEIKERESTAFIAIEDPEIAALVKWIRLKAPTEAIQVSDLQDHSSYSLSSIKSKFSKFLGHSPKDEIKQVRLARLKQLLQNIGKPMAQISSEMDFRSVEEMSRFFLRETGARPNAYREQLLHKKDST